MKLMKEVKRYRDGIRKKHKKCKRGENSSTAQCQLPLSGTLKDPLAPLRGEMPLRGRTLVKCCYGDRGNSRFNLGVSKEVFGRESSFVKYSAEVFILREVFGGGVHPL
ncbi:hypothetical protein LR48_Vigan148s002300 [Vigna angularis]|uniref:Uncharacterized protein n=1 Tax=Phaseolus angularis TaxID=3914 RepID=A0A0L9T6C4_PHAAN|nr:hypothetical protein LR48_Vigan148s002300 [Vigna angularis]